MDRAVEMVRQTEQIKGQVSQQTKASSADASLLSEVARAQTRQRQNNSNACQASHYEGSGGDTKKCFRCGKNHPRLAQCAARNAHCQKIGHFAAVCCSAKVNELVNVTAEQEPSQNGGHFLGEIKTACNIADSTTPWTVWLRISNMPITFKIDTGTDTSVISENTYWKLRPPLLLTKDNAALQDFSTPW